MLGQKRRNQTGSKRRFAWIYSSPRWRALRKQAMDRAGECCEYCFSIGEIQVHHKTPVSLGGAIWDLANLEVVCRSCHLEAHRKIEAEKMPEWQRRLYELVDRPVVPRIQRISLNRPGGQLS